MLIKNIFSKMKKTWGLHEKDNVKKHVNVIWKYRKIAGIILIILILLKVGMLFVKFFVPNPGLKEVLEDIFHHEKHIPFPTNAIPGVVIGSFFVFLSYSIGSYTLLNKKNKITEGFFTGVNKKIIRLFIILIITYAITLYFTYDGYNNAIHDINKKIKIAGGKSVYHINILFFVPVIISASTSFFSLGIFYLTVKWLDKKTFNK